MLIRGGKSRFIDLSDVPTSFSGAAGQVVTVNSGATGLIFTSTGSGGIGDVIGPASATDNAIVRFSGSTGKLIKNSGILIDESNYLTGVAGLTVTGTISGSTISGANSNWDDAYNKRVDTWLTPLQYVSKVASIKPATTTISGVALFSSTNFDVTDATVTIKTGGVDLSDEVTGILDETNGGTGQNTITTGDLLYGSASNVLSKLASGAAGSYLRSAGASTAPLWSTLILPNAATANRVVYATGTNTWGESANFTYSGNVNLTDGLFKTTGTGAGYRFDDRTTGTAFQWYASGDIARLYNGSTDVFTVNTSGDGQFDGDLLVDGGNIGLTADTDLLALSSGLLTIAGDLSFTGNPTWTSGGSNINLASATGATLNLRPKVSAGTTTLNFGASTDIITVGGDFWQVDSSGNLTLDGDILVNGGEIGITGDADLLNLTANYLTVNGAEELGAEIRVGGRGDYVGTAVKAAFYSTNGTGTSPFNVTGNMIYESGAVATGRGHFWATGASGAKSVKMNLSAGGFLSIGQGATGAESELEIVDLTGHSYLTISNNTEAMLSGILFKRARTGNPEAGGGAIRMYSYTAGANATMEFLTLSNMGVTSIYDDAGSFLLTSNNGGIGAGRFNTGTGAGGYAATLHVVPFLRSATSGTLTVTNGSASVATSADLTSHFSVNDPIRITNSAASPTEILYFSVSAIDSNTITLDSAWTGTNSSTAVAVKASTSFDAFRVDNGDQQELFSISQQGVAVWNENGRDADFRMEGDTYENLFFLDASADAIGLGTNAPADMVHMVTANGRAANIRLAQTSQRTWAIGVPASQAYFSITDVTGSLETTRINYADAATDVFGLLSHNGINLSKIYSVDEDFVGGSSTSGSIGKEGWSYSDYAGTASFAYSTAVTDANNFGVVLLNTGNGLDSDDESAALYMGSSILANLQLGGGAFSYETLVNIPTLATAGQDYILLIGLGNSIPFLGTVTDSTNGVYFKYNRSASANWQIVTADNGTRTTTTTSTAVGTGWTKLRAEINAGGTSVTFYVNGTSVGTTTTNIPITAGRFVMPDIIITATNGTSDKLLYVDYWRSSARFTSAR